MKKLIKLIQNVVLKSIKIKLNNHDIYFEKSKNKSDYNNKRIFYKYFNFLF